MSAPSDTTTGSQAAPRPERTRPRRADSSQAKDRERTEYVILRLTDEGGWAVLDETVKATNKDGALRSATKPMKEGGSFKAIAKSAWIGGLKVGKREVTETTYEEITDH